MADETVDVGIQGSQTVSGPAAEAAAAVRGLREEFERLQAAAASGEAIPQGAFARIAEQMAEAQVAAGGLATELGGVATAAVAAAGGVDALAAALDRQADRIVANAALAGRLEASFGPLAGGRQISSARGSASVFAEDLSSMATLDAAVRDAAVERNAALAASRMAQEGAAASLIGYTAAERSAADSASVFAQRLGLLSREEVAISQAQAAASTEKFAQSLIGVATSGRTATSAAADFRAALATAGREVTAGGELRAIGEEAEKAGKSLTFNAAIIRHTFGIIDSAARGARGAMFSSIGAMARDSGLLTSQWGLMAAAGITAFAAIGYAAEQAAQRFSSIRDAASELALKGFGDDTAQLTAEYDRLKESTNSYAGTIRDLQAELSKLPPPAQASRTQIAELATALAGLRREDPAKVIDGAVKAAERGLPAYAAWLTETFGLQHSLTATGQTLEEVAKSSTNLEEGFRTVTETAKGFREQTVQAGNESLTAKNSIVELAMQLGYSGEVLGTTTEQMEAFTNAVDKVISPAHAAADAIGHLSGAIDAENAAIAVGNESLDKRTHLLQMMKDAQAGASRLGAAGGEYGVGQEAASKAANAAANLRAEAARMAPEPAAALDLEATRITSEAAMRRAQSAADYNKELEVQKGLIEATRKAYQGDERAPAVQQAEAKYLEIQDQAAKQSVQIQIEAEQEKASAIKRGGAERTAALQEAARLTAGARYSGGEPMFSPQEIARAQEAANRAQVAQQSAGAGMAARIVNVDFSAFMIAEKNKLTAFRGSSEQQQAVLNEIRAKAEETYGATSAAAARNAPLAAAEFRKVTAEIDRLAEAVKRADFGAMFTSAKDAARDAQTELRDFETEIKTRVAVHEITPAQGFGFDLQEIGRQAAVAQEAFAKALAVPDISEADKQKIEAAAHSVQLRFKVDTDDIQKQIAEAADKAAEKFTKPFEKVFDSLGGQLEKTLGDALLHRGTMAKNLKTLYQDAIGQAIHLAGSSASEIGASFLGPMVGVQGATGIGSLVSKFFGNQLMDLFHIGGSGGQPATGGTGGIPGGVAGEAGNLVGKMVAQQTQQLTTEVTQLSSLTSIAATSAATAANTAALVGTSGAGAAGSITGGAISAGGAAASAGQNSFLGSVFSGIGGLLGIGGGAAGSAAFTGGVGDTVAGAAETAFLLSRGGTVPAASDGFTVPAAQGGFTLPRSFGTDSVMTALTPGETVLPVGEKPSAIAEALTRGDGGRTINLHLGEGGMFTDGPAFMNWLKNNGGLDLIHGAVRSGFQSNGLTPRSLAGQGLHR